MKLHLLRLLFIGGYTVFAGPAQLTVTGPSFWVMVVEPVGIDDKKVCKLHHSRRLMARPIEVISILLSIVYELIFSALSRTLVELQPYA